MTLVLRLRRLWIWLRWATISLVFDFLSGYLDLRTKEIYLVYLLSHVNAFGLLIKYFNFMLFIVSICFLGEFLCFIHSRKFI